MSPPLRTTAFTLVEILVSILIFSIVSLAMITILITSTNVFRAGEYGRASTDEAVAALGTLDDDVKHMVAGRDGGFFLAQLFPDVPTGGNPNGNCVVAFLIEQPAATSVGQKGEYARQLVVYWVDTDPATGDSLLVRAQSNTAEDDGDNTTTTELDVVNKLVVTHPPPVARRCLHFAAWVSTDDTRRNGPDDWANTGGTSAPLALNPTSGATTFYCTEAGTRPTSDPFPTAVRFTLSLAAGRYAPAGYVIKDDGTSIRVAGITALPTAHGSMVRIDDEWIAYTGFSNGAIQVDSAPIGRGVLRSTQATHDRNAKVQLGQLYSLARTFPH